MTLSLEFPIYLRGTGLPPGTKVQAAFKFDAADGRNTDWGTVEPRTVKADGTVLCYGDLDEIRMGRHVAGIVKAKIVPNGALASADPIGGDIIEYLVA